MAFVSALDATPAVEVDLFERGDGLATQSIIRDRPIRVRVMQLICKCISDLIDAAGPEVVAMTTHAADLPAKALRKYDDIVRILTLRGYEVGPMETWHGHHAWTLARRPELEDA